MSQMTIAARLAVMPALALASSEAGIELPSFFSRPRCASFFLQHFLYRRPLPQGQSPPRFGFRAIVTLDPAPGAVASLALFLASACAGQPAVQCTIHQPFCYSAPSGEGSGPIGSRQQTHPPRRLH